MSVLQPINELTQSAKKNRVQKENVFSEKTPIKASMASSSPRGKGAAPVEPSSAMKKGKSVAVDIVTGKKIVSVYFNPAHAVDLDKAVHTEEWLDQNLYQPCAVVKSNTDTDIVTVRMADGTLVKMTSENLDKVTEQDSEGVADILKLKDFSEMSLIHSLRVRYARDEIYTFVGPILISINPYKWFKDLYSEQTMIDYHARNTVRIVTAPA